MNSKVYVLPDSQNRITRCEGGYTMGNITNPSEWVFIDEGTGDRFNLCQSHYLPGGIYADDGIPKYKLVDGQPVERTAEEIEADRESLPKPDPSVEEQIYNDLAAAYAEGVSTA